MFAIEKAIPLPPAAPRPGRAYKYPFLQMEVGDSFLAGLADAEKLWTAAWRFQQKHPAWQYRTRKSEEGVRIWRTA
jgi:hypothetical protein